MELTKDRKVRQKLLRHAAHDIQLARWLLKGGFYSHASFYAFRASQESLMRYLEVKGEYARMIFTLLNLVGHCVEYDATFLKYYDDARKLDRYSSFGDKWRNDDEYQKSEAVTESAALEVVRKAKEIHELVKSRLKT